MRKMKEKYVDVKVRTIEFLRGDTVLAGVGSIIESAPITVNSNDVDIEDLTQDSDFDSSPFSNPTF